MQSVEKNNLVVSRSRNLALQHCYKVTRDSALQPTGNRYNEWTTSGAAMDLVIRNASLPDGRTSIDIAVRDGRIAEIGPALSLIHI